MASSSNSTISGVTSPATSQNAVKATGINHLHLNVRDIDRAVHFYQEAFGLKESFRTGGIVFLEPEGRGDSLALHQAEPVGLHGVQHFGFRLNVHDLDAAIAQVERAGGKLVSRGKHGGQFPYAYVADPDGYVIEL